nr:hypothetical protein [Tanacetum cinerariifolium]
MANNYNNHVIGYHIAEMIRVFTINNEATKKRKREDNLRNWKWSDPIVVDNLPDKVEPANVPNIEETTTEQHVMVSENNNSNVTHCRFNNVKLMVVCPNIDASHAQVEDAKVEDYQVNKSEVGESMVSEHQVDKVDVDDA